MRPIVGTFLVGALAVASITSPAQAGPGFDVITLGARGGIEAGNLTAFMISPVGDGRAVTCDAGSLVNGLRVADEKGVFDAVAVPADSPFTRVGYVLTEQIKGYLISHAHLDHVAGLVIASPDDAKKPIYGLPSVLEDIQGTYFNWEAWPNFGPGGKEPQLKKYELTALAPGEPRDLSGTAMQVTAYPLSHGGVESTAFLIESRDDALLCFGDTGPDEIEKATNMHDIWVAVADRVKQKQLKAIIIETSYANAQPDKSLFGHLTPEWLQKSLGGLETLAGAGSLKDLPVVISHVKYSLKKGELPTQTILGELEGGNTLGVKYLIPEQGMNWRF
jgi:3',5'-cyclic-nucleotide phosphodiesterase